MAKNMSNVKVVNSSDVIDAHLKLDSTNEETEAIVFNMILSSK